MKRVHLVIHGRVQGVGFRYFAQSIARVHRVGGEVRNRPDGAVEVDAEGDAAAVAAFVEAMREGPRAARVDRIEEDWSEATMGHREFRIGR
jgi:acylphosphatase